MAFPVLLDTCILFPMYLRDTLLRLAVAEVYQPLWSADILGELQTVLVREHVMAQDGAERIIGLMRRYFPEAEVTGYDDLTPSMPCDPGDRHVLAAAVRGGAGAIVTANLADFPPKAAADHGLDIISPDGFLLDLLDLTPTLVLTTLADQVSGYRREPTTVDGLMVALARSGAPGFADEIRRRLA
jgi:predicted nucleic acid-binding protein